MEMDLSECQNLAEISDLSKATNLKSLKLNYCECLVMLPSTIGNLQKLELLEMKECTALEVLPNGVNLSSLEIVNLNGCTRLRSFPQISRSIKELYLNDTATEEVPCCIENFSRLAVLTMRGCKRLKNISPNIFKLTSLKYVDFQDCRGVFMAFSDATVVVTTEDRLLFSEDILCNRKDGFKFTYCFNLDGDVQELILRSYFKPTLLPGGDVPLYFTHRASRNYLTVTLPQCSLSQEFLGFKACVVVEPITNPEDYAKYLGIRWHFRGCWYHLYVYLDSFYTMDHLVLVPFKFRLIGPPSKLGYNDVEFEFSCIKHDFKPSPFQRIKGCGIRVLKGSPSLGGGDGSKKPML